MTDIGATQQLDKELETEKQTIVEIDSRVAELKETTAQENIEVKDKIRNLFDVLFAEESGDRYGRHITHKKEKEKERTERGRR